MDTPQIGDMAYWSHPIDLHFATKGLQGGFLAWALSQANGMGGSSTHWGWSDPALLPFESLSQLGLALERLS